MSADAIVVLGAGGQLGRTLQADWSTAEPSLAGANNTPSVGRPHLAPTAQIHYLDKATTDICDTRQLAAQLDALQPRVLINAAAYTRVDQAEQEFDQALAINRDGVANLARWASAHQCRLIHISTDFVFAGDASRPYRPGDTTGPLNRYGESKLAGEQALAELYPAGSLVVRTSWLYSRHAPNFVATMLRLMRTQERLRVVADQVGTPTSTHSLVSLLGAMVDSDINSGTWHWSDAGMASWYDFAVAIQEEALAAGLIDNAIPIEPVDTSQFPTPARRPAFSVLDKSDSYTDFAIEPVHWRVELRRVIHEVTTAHKDGA